MTRVEPVVLHLPAGAHASDRFRIARVTAQLTPPEVAVLLGISLKTYQRIENGSRQPDAAEVRRMAALTGQALAFFGPYALNVPERHQLVA